MKILIFTAFYLPGFKGGGPIRTISNMVDSLADQHEFFIFTNNHDLGENTSYSSINSDEWNKLGAHKVFYCSPGFKYIFNLWNVISKSQAEVLNLNSFFSFKFSILPIIFWLILKRKRPIILGPRGEFSQGALKFKSFKKFSYIKIIKLLNIYKNIIWLASTHHEEIDIKRVIANDANIRTAIDIAKPADILDLSKRSENSALNIVFISRISPKKNLDGALNILKNVSIPVKFDVYGPLEDKIYWSLCLKISESLPSNIEFNHLGEISPTNVPTTLAMYDLFFLPTQGENFGHVIAEALSSGLPILISDTTPWRDLENKLLGWDISLDKPEKFVSCIEKCFRKSPDEYNEWRQFIRNWAINNIGSMEAIEQNKNLFVNLES